MSQQQSASSLITLPGFSGAAGEAGGPPSPPNPPRPWWRRRGGIVAIAIFLLAVLLGGLFLLRLSRRHPVTYQYQQASQDDLSLTVSATGPVQSATYNLIFSGTGGKIDEIDVAVGQTVTQGQVLARLDKTALQDAVNQQQAAVLAAQQTLNSAQASLNSAQASSQANVNAAQTALNNAQANQSRTQASSQASISAAQTTLSNDQTNLANTQASSQASINAAQTTLDNAQTNLKHTLAVSQAQVNVAFDQEQQAIQACKGNAQCIQLAEDQYNQVVATTDANNAQAQAAVNTDQKALATAQATANANNAQAQARVDADQKALNSAQAAANANNTAAQGQVNTAQSQLNTAQATANANDTTAQGQVNSAQGQFNTAVAQLNTAKHNLANTTLTAPHDGIVTTINGTVGGSPGLPTNASNSSTTTAGATFIQIVDTSSLQVQANVNETDTANLKVQESAVFTVNAYGTRQFRGTVSAISPNGQTISNVVTFPVTIDVDMSSLQGATLLPGMTANVTVTVLNRHNVLLIPVDAVNFARLASEGNTTNGVPQLLSKDEAASAVGQARERLNQLENANPTIIGENPIPAFVLAPATGSNNQFIVKPVVLGLTDGVVYEVLNGLSTGDTIVVGAGS